MPTPQEIEEMVQSFKAAAGKETWASKSNDPDGAKLNKATTDLRDLLNEGDLNAYSQKAFDFMESQNGSPSVGSFTCQALLSKGDAGKAVATDVAKRVMTAELGRYQISAGGFIRSQHAINGLTKQFIQETSPDCERQMKERVDSIAKRYTGLDQIAASNDWSAKTEMTTKLGKEMVAVMSTPPLTQDSVSFLKELRETIEGDAGYIQKFKNARPQATTEEAEAARLEVADIVVNNNAALRFAGPLFQKNALLQNNELWKDASGAALSTFSGARKDNIKAKVKTNDDQVDDLGKPRALTQEEVAQNKHLSDISKGIHEERGMVLEIQGHISSGRVAGSQKAASHLEATEFDTTAIDVAAKLEKARLDTELTPQLAKVPGMEKRLADLNKTISIEKIKAFFSSKGVAGTKAELKNEIEGINKAVDQSKEQLKKFDGLKGDTIHNQEKAQLIKKTGLDPEQLETALQLPAVKKAMMDFANKEFSPENLEFHEAVSNFRAEVQSGASIEQLRNSAENIRKTFIDTKADKQVNIGSGLRGDVEDALDQINQSQPDKDNFTTWGPETREQLGKTFDAADQEIVKVIKVDTMTRFIKDPSFKEAVKESLKPETPSVRQSMSMNIGPTTSLGPSLGGKVPSPTPTQGTTPTPVGEVGLQTPESHDSVKPQKEGVGSEDPSSVLFPTKGKLEPETPEVDSVKPPKLKDDPKMKAFMENLEKTQVGVKGPKVGTGGGVG